VLSTEQKRQRDEQIKRLNKSGLLDDLMLREAGPSYDLNRITELWANLSMVQSMKGFTYWIDKQKKSGLSWKEYIQKLYSLQDTRFIVFDDQEKIFGFSFLLLNKMPNGVDSKAIIKELYLEPSHRSEEMNQYMAELLRDCVRAMGVEYIEFDIKDLDSNNFSKLS
jgi:hypothetical protein